MTTKEQTLYDILTAIWQDSRSIGEAGIEKLAKQGVDLLKKDIDNGQKN